MMAAKSTDRLPNGRAATLRDVATLAGVDISTVSKVLHEGNIKVREETARRIFEAASRLQYSPNAAARSLRLRHSRALGLLLPDFTNPVYATIVRGAVRRATELGYVMLVAELRDDADESQYRQLVHERRIDGLIVATAREASDLVSKLAGENIPYMFVNRRVPGSRRSTTVDDAAGGALAARVLREAGHRRLGVIAGPPDVDTAVRRLTGFQDACRELRLAPPRVARTQFTAADGYDALTRLCSGASRPTAVFASNLLTAIGALAAARAANLAIPEDLSIIGFDESEIAAYTAPPLTSIRMPFDEMGIAVVDALHRVIQGGRPRDVVVDLPPILVERASVGPPPSRRKTTPTRDR